MTNTKYDPTEITIEVWFRANNVLTKTTDVILGLAPYKIRKRAN